MPAPSVQVDVGPFARALRRAWRDTRIAVFMPLFLAGSITSVVALAALTQGSMFEGASFSNATGGRSYHAFVALISLLALFLVCIYRKSALYGGAASLVVLFALLTLEIQNALAPPLRWIDVLLLGLIAMTACLAVDFIWTLRWLLRSRRPSFAHLEGFARLCRERRRLYWAIEPLRLLWLLPALLLGLLVTVLLQFGKAYFAVKVIGIPTDAFQNMQRSFAWLEANPGLYIGYFVVESLQIVLTIVALVYIFRFFWALVRRSAEKVIADTSYQPIVFLRSFRDEEAHLRSRRAFDRMTFRKRRLEEVVVRTLAPLGPAVAIGMPGERIPKLGALRAYYREDEWREAVLSWIRRSYVVVVVAGTSPWALWEFNHALVTGFDGRLLLVVPPDADGSVRAQRWQKVCEAAKGTRWHQAMQEQDPARLLAVVFGEDGQLITFDGTTGEQVDVEVALRVAAGHLAAVRAATVARSGGAA
jgi:hypothetical protein